jgi:hypothetical protein
MNDEPSTCDDRDMVKANSFHVIVAIMLDVCVMILKSRTLLQHFNPRQTSDKLSETSADAISPVSRVGKATTIESKNDPRRVSRDGRPSTPTLRRSESKI